MFGITSFGISLVYLLCILSAILCLTYGIFNWNKGNENEEQNITEELDWQKEEVQIDEKL